MHRNRREVACPLPCPHIPVSSCVFYVLCEVPLARREPRAWRDGGGVNEGRYDGAGHGVEVGEEFVDGQVLALDVQERRENHGHSLSGVHCIPRLLGHVGICMGI